MSRLKSTFVCASAAELAAGAQSDRATAKRRGTRSIVQGGSSKRFGGPAGPGRIRHFQDTKTATKMPGFATRLEKHPELTFSPATAAILQGFI
jgi:hypothetical protein